MYTREFFLMNPEFIRWVKSPDDELEIYWKNWLVANPDSIEALKEARELVNGIKFANKIPNEDLKNSALSEILKESEFSSSRKNIKEGRSLPNLKFILKVAAALVSGFLFYWYFYQLSNEKPVQPEIALMEKQANIGEKLSFTLSDGTRVWLNSKSKLIFPQKFEDSTRRVELIGEGYFEVFKDEQKPFKVITNNSITTALGTSFNINSKKEGVVKISLVSGSVFVEDEEILANQQVLAPSEEILINRNLKQFELKNFDTSNVIAWKEGKLIFENDNFDEVIQKLVEWYGVDFELENRGNVKWDFSGTYQNQSLEIVLNSMSYVENFEFELKGKKVKIKF